MRFFVEIETDNAAFEEGMKGAEVARILREIAKKVEDQRGEDDAEYSARDGNGNKVGKFGFADI